VDSVHVCDFIDHPANTMTLAAVVQLTSSGVIADNLAIARRVIGKAAGAGAKAVFLPEATDFIAPSTSVASLTYSQDAKSFVEGIQSAARAASVWISVGIHEPSAEHLTEQRCFNTQLLIDAKGEILSRYRKTHLFDVDIKGGIKILESDTTVSGKDICPPEMSPVGKVGVSICGKLAKLCGGISHPLRISS
jgi:predicted amidohydrolase